jgi:hypothetical protein
MKERIQLASAWYSNLSSPIQFVVDERERESESVYPIEEHLCIDTSPKKEEDMYKQFSLLILLERNRHVIKERFLWTKEKKKKKNRREREK